MPRGIVSARESGAIFREAEIGPGLPDQRHHDLLESEHLHGTAHNSNGRVLGHLRLAATPQEQESRLANPAGWNPSPALTPSPTAVQGARSYNASRGMGDPHQDHSATMQNPARVRSVGRAYDALPTYDAKAVPAFHALGNEVNQQYDHMTKNLGISVQSVDHDPYPDVSHMMDDVNNNKRLQVLSTASTGGHPFFSNEDNDKFRAVHDFFGHAATGRGFDRHGEHAAFQAHSKMFSPQAQPALASETLGQNSSLILNGQFAPQKIALLPQEMYQQPAQQQVAKIKTAQVKPRYILLPHWDPYQAAEVLHDHADAMGYPHQRLAMPEVSPGLIDLAKQGGFTFHDHVGDGPTSGYMVSQNKNTEKTLPIDTLTPQHINQFVHQNHQALTKPNNYLGGWLDGKNFYLDVSTHRPTLDRAAHDAAMADQLAIYDLDKGQAINTPDAIWQAGDPGLALPEDHHQNPFYGAVQAEPHDWTTHTLGDPGDEELYGLVPHGITAADNPFEQVGLQNKGEAPGSTHGAIIQNNPTTGENWLVKPDTKGGGALAKLDVAANHIASQSGLEAPATFEGSHQGVPASAQLMVPGAVNPYAKEIDPESPSISDQDLLTIQKHHALDWMIGNHDGHGGQFIRKPDGSLVGIDKAQAFKFANNDRLHWNFHPNGPMYGESEPVYNTLYRNFAKGGRPMNDPTQGELGKYVQGLQSIPDDEYAATLRPYAETAAANGILGKDFSKGGKFSEVGWTPPKFKANDVDGFLQHAVTRKNHLMEDLHNLHERALAHRMTGTKIAKRKVADKPDVSALQSMHQQMGSHGAKVYSDPQGQWLIKKPPEGADFMSHLDKATADLQVAAGLPNAETHQLTWKHGEPVTAVKMLPGAKQAFRRPPNLTEIHPNDLLTLQKHQALDWLMGNHDGHVGNFMRLPPQNPADPADPGQLVGIDKGQAGKYLGRDKLSNTFHPNFYAREPVYNQLWRDFAGGKPGEMNDPRDGELGNFVKNLQGISDDHLKHIFRPYAQSAAEAGLLANVNDDGQGNADPRRDLGDATIRPNDPEAFLEAMAKRKNRLHEELGSFYDRQAMQRHHAIDQQALRDPSTGEAKPLPVSGPETGLHVVM